MPTTTRALASTLLLLAACSGGDKPDDTAAVDGCPVAVMDPTEFTWTDLPAGELVAADLTVLNNCEGDTNLTLELSIAEEGFQVSPGLGSVAPGEVATFEVFVQVSDQPGASGTLQIVTNDPDAPLVTIPLNATLDPDQDGDGADYTTDCNDFNAGAFPGGTETWYDGIDGDCSGGSDYDQDGDFENGDAYGGTDCDDTDATINSAAAEVYYDGVDANCDGLSDDDADGDGADIPADCNDTDPTMFPGASETWYDGVDSDCAGGDDYDQDGDGDKRFGSGGADCDDSDPTMYYGAPDAWYDGIDSNCDGHDDFDQDGDGYQEGADDCDDTDAGVSPADTEVRNGVDDDCDGTIDEGLVAYGDVVITEIMTNPAAVSDTVGEWFELYNASGYELDLLGWTIYSDDGGSLTIGSSLPVAPGGYVVLGAEDDTSLNGGVTVDYQYTRSDFALSDTEGIYVLAGGTGVTGFEFDSGWPISEGYSLTLDPTGHGDPTDVDKWCVATSAISGGDYGTPGAANDGCPQIDNDGDGVSDDDGDCDDADAAIGPDAVETDDGVDEDCSGLVDDVVYDLALASYTRGSTATAYETVATTGDLDGDGALEVVYSTSNAASTRGHVYILDGGDYATWSGTVNSYDEADIAMGTSDAYASTVLGDNTGDGRADLAIAIYTNSTAPSAWYLFEDPAGSVALGDATVTGSTTSGAVDVQSGADLNGDGVAEVVMSNSLTSAYGTSYGGMVGVYDVAGLSGAITEGSADLILYGTAYEQIGYYGVLPPSDMNGDGYVDLAIPTEAWEMHVYLGDGFATTGTHDLASVTDFTFSGVSSSSFVRDVDGDGAADFMTYGGEIWTNLAGASGTLTTADATTDIGFSSGYSCQDQGLIADVDADGASDIVMSCSYYVGGGTTEYLTMFFGPDILAASTANQSQAFLSLVWEGASYSYAVRVDDLDGDGDDEAITYGNDSSYYSYFVDL